MPKKFVLHCPVVSPHHLSFMTKVVQALGDDQVLYVHTIPLTDERKKLGWGESSRAWIRCVDGDDELYQELVNCDVLISSIRDIVLFARRAHEGRTTIYMSERWFKPIQILGHLMPGWLRLFHPVFAITALRFARLINSSLPFYYFPMSIWAARDMAKLCGYRGHVTFEHKAGGRIWAGKHLIEKFRIWAYFVESTSGAERKKVCKDLKSVLWVGRMVGVKRVSDIVKATQIATEKGIRIELNLYGHGEDEINVKRAAEGMLNVHFHDPVPIARVRDLMRENDVYVLSSDAMEGWGAVVNEAMEEGMCVIGTHEAGASSTLLPKENLYHAGDVTALAELLTKGCSKTDIDGWSCKAAATEVCRIIETNNF